MPMFSAEMCGKYFDIVTYKKCTWFEFYIGRKSSVDAESQNAL
jgi:hypothetical protein